MSTRLNILTKSLIKKQNIIADELNAHVTSVSERQGQPFNLSAKGIREKSKIEKECNRIQKMEEEILKTKEAIADEESKIAWVDEVSKDIPQLLLDKVEEGVLTQWRKYPNRFFVVGVKKFRIIWNIKEKRLSCKFASTVKDPQQYEKIKNIYNDLKDRTES